MDYTLEGVLSIPWGKFLHNPPGGCSCALDPWGIPSVVLYFTGDLVDDLNSPGSFLGDF